MFVETNCPSCKALKNYLNSIDIKFVECNIDNADNKVDALMLNIYSVPALVLGKEVLPAKEIFDSNNSLRKDKVTGFVRKE